MVQLHSLLVDCADAAIAKQDPDTGAMPGGHNGPWNDPETPVRNTGHWAITFLKSYELTGEERFRTAANDAIDYLESEAARPHGVTFHHRKSAEKDRCNGLIGQAWSIEALVAAADPLDRPELREFAEAIFLAHPFDERLCVWHPVEIDGTKKPIDMTFNHQLWFAAAGGLLADDPRTDPEVDRQIRQYLDSLETNLNVYDSGLIYHPFKPDFDPIKYGKILFEGVKAGIAHTMVIGVIQSALSGGDGDSDDTDEWLENSIGYHSFNLYAFALLYEQYPDHPLWSHEKLKRALEYARSDAYRDGLEDNPYGYPYNCSGIEMAYVCDVFGDGGEESDEMKRQWLEAQFDRTFDPETLTMGRNNPDPTTLTARLYEATRIADCELSLSAGEGDT